jgi:hypothetical protein
MADDGSKQQRQLACNSRRLTLAAIAVVVLLCVWGSLSSRSGPSDASMSSGEGIFFVCCSSHACMYVCMCVCLYVCMYVCV